MKFASINPVSGNLVKSFSAHRWQQVETMIRKAEHGFAINRTSPFNTRAKRFKQLAELMQTQREDLAALITLEMGKPISQARVEIDKCIWICRYYADHAKQFLHDEKITTEHADSLITYAPMGIILAIKSFNYPFWQTFRTLVPALMAGNTVLLKHDPHVPQCALAIERLYVEAGFPAGMLQVMFINERKLRTIIEDPRIQMVSLTGSDETGSIVGELAGRSIKKMLLELSANDPFIVLEDANLKAAAEIAIQSRMSNTGQSRLAAKRFIVLETALNPFLRLLAQGVQSLQVGDPTADNTDIGPLAHEDLLKKIDRQVKQSVKMGAEVIAGGTRLSSRPGFYYAPTVLAQVTEDMPLFKEEVFGPIAAVMSVKSVNEAIEVANRTQYGLSASIWTVNTERASRLASRLTTGSVFINTLPITDPRLPIGGVKRSGYGKQLSQEGIREFVHSKVIVVG